MDRLARAWPWLWLLCLALGAEAGWASSSDLASGTRGRALSGQPFADGGGDGARGAEVFVLGSVDRSVVSVALAGLRVGSGEPVLLTAWVEDGAQRRLAEGSLEVAAGFQGRARLPLSATLRAGSPYRVGFSVAAAAGQVTADLFAPAFRFDGRLPFLHGGFPYTEGGGFLRVVGAWQARPGGRPPSRTSALPRIQLLYEPRARTTAGPVRGIERGEVAGFLGIPFARPATGDLRFRRPSPPEPWTTPLLANSRLPYPTSEDPSPLEDLGLRLNVWAPVAPGPPRPVMVYLPGGSFLFLSHAGDGDSLALAGDVVVVTLPYRVGVLGFLALEELRAEDPDGSTGNQGMLDQLLGLRWVQDNIAAFGGDPEQVTVFGFSAGAASTCLLGASPLAKGLFARAIMQSWSCSVASPLRPGLGRDLFWRGAGHRYFAIEQGEAIAAELGCPPDDRLQCLRDADLQTLWDTANDVMGRLVLPGAEPPWGPSIDGYFLRDHALMALRAGSLERRPFMAGATSRDGTYVVQNAPVGTSAEYEAFLRATVDPELVDAVLELYPPDLSGSPFESLITLATDGFDACPAAEATQAATDGGSDAYLYHFSFRDPVHGGDLRYLFRSVDPADGAGSQVQELVRRLWTSFAREGRPDSDPEWPRVAGGEEHLEIDLPPSTPASFREGRCRALGAVVDALDADRDGRLAAVDACTVVELSQRAERATLRLRGLDGPAGEQALELSGSFQPAGEPAGGGEQREIDPGLHGVHLHLADSGGALYEVNVPGEGPGQPAPCGPGDGWRSEAGGWTYDNASGALPPRCAPGSARGLGTIRIRPARPAPALRFEVEATSASLERVPTHPVEFLQLSLALGARASTAVSAQARHGQCADLALFQSPHLPVDAGVDGQPFCRRAPPAGTLAEIECRQP